MMSFDFSCTLGNCNGQQAAHQIVFLEGTGLVQSVLHEGLKVVAEK